MSRVVYRTEVKRWGGGGYHPGFSFSFPKWWGGWRDGASCEKVADFRLVMGRMDIVLIHLILWRVKGEYFQQHMKLWRIYDIKAENV